MSERHRVGMHDVWIQLLEVARGHVRWRSRIADLPWAHGRHTLPSAEMARSEALMNAQIAIARMKANVANAD